MSAVAFWLAPDWGDADMAHWPPYREPFWMREPYREPEPPKPLPAPPRPRVVVEPPSNRFAVDERKHAIEWACNQVLCDPNLDASLPGERVVHVSYLGASDGVLTFNIYALHRDIPMRWEVKAGYLEQYVGYRRRFEILLLEMPFSAPEVHPLLYSAAYIRPAKVERNYLAAGTSRCFGPT